MSNILQYLVQQTDEFRVSYQDIGEKIDDLLDKLDLIERRLMDIETRINMNRLDDKN